MPDIVRINVETGNVARAEMVAEQTLLGGRALTSRIVHDEVPPTCHPLGGKNKLVVATGLLGGTAASCVNRISIGAKSPLTGGIKEANCGGVSGFRLARLGIRALVFEGKPDPDVMRVVVVGSDGIRLDEASDLRGLGNYDCVARLHERYGERAASLSIGPAGEMRLSAASIASTDVDGHPSRQAARGGLGAVMGSKGIKAMLVVDAGSSPEYHDKELFESLASEFSKKLTVSKKSLTNFGTAVMVRVADDLGGIAVHNFRQGSFDKIENLSGETMREIILARGGKPCSPCMPGCVIRCSNLYRGPDNEHLTSSLEYETIIMLGANCGIDDLDTVAQMDYLCDDLGLDTIDTGAAMGLLMEAGLIKFGDGKRAMGLLEEVRNGSVAGRLIGSGAAIVGKVMGLDRVPAVKGQACVAYDLRTFKGMGVSFATSPMGADHTSGPAIPGRSGFDQSVTYELTEARGQTTLSHDLQIMIAVCDSLGWCFFVGPDPNTMALSAQLLNAKNGTNLTADEIVAVGVETLKIEKEFNRQAGFTCADDRLPDFFYEEPSPPSGRTFDIPPEDLDRTLAF